MRYVWLGSQLVPLLSLFHMGCVRHYVHGQFCGRRCGCKGQASIDFCSGRKASRIQCDPVRRHLNNIRIIFDAILKKKQCETQKTDALKCFFCKNSKSACSRVEIGILLMKTFAYMQKPGARDSVSSPFLQGNFAQNCSFVL